MNHLSNDRIYDLAVKISADADFSPEEKKMLKHIASCDACYTTLCCAMVALDTAEHAVEYARAAQSVPARERIRAVIRLAVDAVNTALDQIETGVSSWAFRRAPMALAGVRSASRRNPAKKLMDASNSETFVAYDPQKKLLMFQIDSTDCDGEPKAWVCLSDGEKISVQFEKHEHLFWGVVQDINEGEYEILLEK